MNTAAKRKIFPFALIAVVLCLPLPQSAPSAPVLNLKNRAEKIFHSSQNRVESPFLSLENATGYSGKTTKNHGRSLTLTSSYLKQKADETGQELLGLSIEMDLPELGLTGHTVLTNIEPTPHIKAGNGRVVTATFHHFSGHVINLTVGRFNTNHNTETTETNSNHPFWSVDRQKYIQAGKLRIGETLKSFKDSGDQKVVIGQIPRPGPTPVYNLEVHGEHVYYVGQNGILVHNTYGDDYITLKHGTSSNRASKITGNQHRKAAGFKSDRDTIYLAEDTPTAEHFALESIVKNKTEPISNHLRPVYSYQSTKGTRKAQRAASGVTRPNSLTVIEFQVPRKLADDLGIGYSKRTRIGVDTGQHMPDIDGGTGFERILQDSAIKRFNEALKSGEITTRRLRVR